MDFVSARSMRRVSTLTEELLLLTKGASSFSRRSVLRDRRTTCSIPLDTNSEATWLPIPGPAPKMIRVRVMLKYSRRDAVDVVCDK